MSQRMRFRGLVISAALGVTGVLIAPVQAAPAVDAAQQVRATSPTNAELRTMAAIDRARALARCVRVQQTETYCLGLGFVDGATDGATNDKTPDYSALAQATAPNSTVNTGAVSMGDWLAERAAMSDAQRQEAEVAEIEGAVSGAAKARQLREELAGGVAAADTVASRRIMDTRATRQIRSYWCGPATMESFDWGDNGTKVSQTAWATRLGTTGNGSSIQNLVRTTNQYTNWDLAAGPYIVRSVSGMTRDDFYLMHRLHLGDSTPAPVIEHPQLSARYFHYLRYNASGHFNVGRGYYTRSSGLQVIQVLEVYNEADWRSGGRTSWGAREISAENLLAATKSHPQSNVGV